MKWALSVLLVFAPLAAAAEEPVKIGVSAPLTGIGAEYGAAVRNGFELAKSEDPALARFELIYDDNKYDSKTGVASYRKLRSGDQVDLIYLWGEPGFSSVAAVAEQDKFPLVAMSTDRVPGIGKKYVVRASNDTFSLSNMLAQELVRRKIENVDIVYAEDPFFLAFIAGLRQALPPHVKVDEAANVAPEVQDFKSVVLKLNQRRPQSVAVFLLMGQSRSFFRQAEQFKLSSVFFGTDVFESREEIRESGPKIQGAFYAIFAAPPEFQETYLKKYQNDSQLPYGYLAYAFAKVLPKIFPAGGPRRAEDALSNIKALTRADTGGAFSFRDDPEAGMHFEFPVVLKAVRGGGVEVIQ